jgi:hypothetical protein
MSSIQVGELLYEYTLKITDVVFAGATVGPRVEDHAA